VLKYPDTRRDLVSKLACRDPHVILRLKIHPEPRLHVKIQTQAQRRIGRDRAAAVDKLADAARGNVDVRRKLTGRDTHRLHEFLQQDLAGVDFVEQFRHVPLLVVVDDLDLVCAILAPDKACRAIGR